MTIASVAIPMGAFAIGVIIGVFWITHTTRVMLEEAIRQYKKSLAAWREVEAVGAAIRAELAAVREAATLTVGMRVN